MNTITHSIKTPSLTEFDLAPYTGKAIQYICLDEQDLSKLSNQGFIHTTHSPIIKLEQTTPLLLSRMARLRVSMASVSPGASWL